jgi:hypothetical protein
MHWQFINLAQKIGCSVVPKDVDERAIMAGLPAKLLKYRAAM